MKAYQLKEPGGVEQLRLTEIPDPEINSGEVLVRVKAIGINPVDAKTRAGKGIYGRIKNSDPLILGWDISGIVEDPGDQKFQVGDEVFGMVNFPGHGRAYAELVAAPAAQLSLKPQQLSHPEAAASTLAALTAWQALFDNAYLGPENRVLIHAAAGGVGHFAVQVAKHLGAYVAATSSAANRDFVLSLGADEHIDYKAVKFEDKLRNIDFVLDTVGGENIERSLNVIKPGGKLISIPTAISDDIKQKAAAKDIEAIFMLVQSNGDDMDAIAGLLSKAVIRPHVSHIFPFSELSAAHLQIETGRTVGKIVIEL